MSKLNPVTYVAALAAISIGCASSPAPVSTTPTVPLAALVEVPTEANPFTVPQAAELNELPVAPWSAAPLGSEAVSPAVLAAWARADNRNVCAPIAPAAMGVADGARARVSTIIEGGWAVEYDRRGMPGLDRRGDACARCGRGVFGIAGTDLTPDDLAGERADAPEPSFADGSHLELEPPAEGESVAAAMITLRGQGCVYQVWSFLGEDHVRELVDGLRRVELREDAPLATR